MSLDLAARDKLAFGYFDDFHEPTMLFWGSGLALKQLEGLLRTVADGQTPQVVLNELPWVAARRNTHLSIELDPAARGLIRVANSTQPAFVWVLNRDLARSFAEKIAPLANASIPCHQYLDADKDECTVKVSFGEYDDLDAS